MAQEHSFDIVSHIDLQEVRNAVQMTLKEVGQRFDFKGVLATVEFDEAKHVLQLHTQDPMKLRNLLDMLYGKLAKRGVPLKAITPGAVQTRTGETVSQELALQQGIPQEKAKEIVKAIKDTKLKVQAQIQNDQVRVGSRSIDDLQAVIAWLRERDFGIAMQCINYR